MISALRKIAGHSELKAPSQVQQMFIDLPQAAGFAGLFASHPPIEDRIAALVKYAGGIDVGPTPSIADRTPVTPELGQGGAPPSRPGPWG